MIYNFNYIYTFTTQLPAPEKNVEVENRIVDLQIFDAPNILRVK